MRLSSIALLLSIGLGCAYQAQAQSYLKPKPPRNAMDDRFRIEVDVMYGTYDTQIRLDDASNAVEIDDELIGVVPGTTVSGEDDLGLASSQVLGQVELTLLPGTHHMVRFNALSMRRTGHRTLTRNVSWGNSTYETRDRVDSHLNLSLLGLTYGYLPFRTDRYELGLSLGLQIGSVSANAEVLSGGGPPQFNKGPRESESGAGPFPLVGIEGRFDFTKRWSVDARWQYLSASWAESLTDLQGVAATINDGRLALRWRQNQHLIYGLGYRYFNIDVAAPNSDPNGAVRLNFAGPLLFVQASL